MAVNRSNSTNIWLAVITTTLVMYVTTTTFVFMNMHDNLVHMTHQLDAIYQAVDTLAYETSWDRFDSELELLDEDKRFYNKD